MAPGLRGRGQGAGVDVATRKGRDGDHDRGFGSAASPLNARQMVRGLGWDVGLPVAAYYLLHLLGVDDLAALLTATVVAGVRVVWAAVRERELNLFATVMLVVFGIGLVLALVSGDARFLLLKNSIVTGAVGVAFLVTTVVGRPLTLAASQSFNPARRAELAERYRSDPRVRPGHRLCSTVWGVALVVEALVRVPLIYLLPIDVMVGVSEAITIVVFTGLIAWTLRYIRHATRTA